MHMGERDEVEIYNREETYKGRNMDEIRIESNAFTATKDSPSQRRRGERERGPACFDASVVQKCANCDGVEQGRESSGGGDGNGNFDVCAEMPRRS